MDKATTRTGCHPRTHMHPATGLLMVFMFAGVCSAPAEPYQGLMARATVTETRCEYAEKPLGIDVAQPRFSWILAAPGRGVMQESYQVLVASTPELLAADKGDLWDSGWVIGGDPASVYQGSLLTSRQIACWKVRIQDEQQKGSPWSDPAIFEMGLLDRADWQGQWIGLAGEDTKGVSPLLRKEFTIDGPIQRARLYAAGIGWSEHYLNGQRIGDSVLDPAATDYDKRILYVTHDVTHLLHTGPNALGAMLGNGWYSQPTDYGYGDSPRLLLELVVELADGTVQHIASDESWRASNGPITQNSIWGGEIYDARLEQPGWLHPGFDDATWLPAVLKGDPGGRLESQRLEPMTTHAMRPILLTSPRPDVHVYEFAELFGGWVRLRVKGHAGTRIAIRYSARAFPEGTPEEVAALQATINHDASEGHATPVDVVPGLADKRRHKGPDGATDYYILKGDPDGEIYEPRFTFHPVRYVQIEGLPAAPALGDVEGRATYAEVDLTGSFACSDPLLNQIQQNCERTFTNSMYGITLDCLYREYWGWLEPASNPSTLFARKFIPRFWAKFLRDVQYAQHEDGVIPDVVPSYPPKGRKTGDPAWAGNYPLVVWYAYQYYGDEGLLADHYPNMKRWVDYLGTLAENGRIEKGGYYGDHMLPGDAPGQEEFISKETPPELLWTGYYFNNTWILAQTAQILGKADEAAAYTERAEAIRTALNEKWLDPAGTHYATNSQTANIAPLAFGVVPEANREAVAKSLIANITDQRGGHLHTGNLGTACIMDALADHGGGAALHRVATSTDYPGWGYMVSQGATSIWEAWGGVQEGFVGYNSGEDSMPMFATISEYFYSDVAGFRGPDYFGTGMVAPGFREITIRPRLQAGLTSASATIRTIRGLACVSWERGENTLSLNATIPANATAGISIPKAGLREVSAEESGHVVWEKGSFVSGTPGIEAATNEDDYVTFEVGSGTYAFTLKGEK